MSRIVRVLINRQSKNITVRYDNDVRKLYEKMPKTVKEFIEREDVIKDEQPIATVYKLV